MGYQHRGGARPQIRRGSLATSVRCLLLGAAALALGGALEACGGKGASLEPRPVAHEDAGARQGEPNGGEPDTRGEPGTPDDPAEADAAAPEPEGPAPLPSDERAELALGGPARTDVVALAVSELLTTYCSGCHSDGMNAGLAGGFDIGELIARGMIVPGASADSPLMQNLLHGNTAFVRPTAGEIALISQFIDRLRTEPPASCERLPFLGVDDAMAAMLVDVNARPEAERPFLRYVGVSYASNAGSCGVALDEQRQALFKLVNTLSSASEIRLPVPIDPEQRLYRVDLRDYGWDRLIDLLEDGVAEHADGWAAIVAVAGASALALSGPEASALASATGTPVPFLPVNALVEAASVGDVYYSLAGLRLSLDDARRDRGIDVLVAAEENTWRRAGLIRGGNNDALITRVLQPGAPAGDYWLYEVQSEVRDSSIYESPLDTGFGDWSQSIFRLPNGLMAFALDQRGQRLGAIPSVCIEVCDAPARRLSIACHGCHAAGLLPVEDGLRAIVAASPWNYDGETAQRTPLVFPSLEEMAALLAGDNARYLAALDQLGVERNAPDPISRVYLQFTTDPIHLERAAAELGVPAAALREHLGELPELAALADPTGTIDRYTLAEGSARALCALTRNRPVSCP